MVGESERNKLSRVPCSRRQRDSRRRTYSIASFKAFGRATTSGDSSVVSLKGDISTDAADIGDRSRWECIKKIENI